MRYLLDTNIVIFILKSPYGPAARRLQSEDPSQISVCSIVEAELYFGSTKYGIPARRRQALDRFLAPFISLPFDSVCVSHYTQIRAELEQAGENIGANDLLIASIAAAHRLTVVTNNSREFRRINGLPVEDWTDETHGQLMN